MSLFALWKNISNPSERIIRNRLAGNLCRCTGYQPIIEAAMKFGNQSQDDKFSKSGADVIQKLLSIQQESSDLDIRTKSLRYFKPVSLKKALEIRKDFPDAAILSGSTDIGVMLNKQKASIHTYLDISGLQELKTVESTGRHLRVGACISLEDMDASLGTKFPAIHEMINLFGSHQIRNLATPGGNIAGASPIGDLPPVLMACKCIVELQSASSRRSMPLEEFITGYHQTAIADDELLTGIIIPFNQDKSIIRSYKISKRKDVDISSVTAGFSLKLDQDNMVKDISLFYGGMAASTGRAKKAEKFLLGKEWTEKNALQAAKVAQTDFEPISDARCEADTRRIMAGNLIIKFWEDSTKKKNG
jgi:xanthine dehydrogenase small subunit